MIWWILIAVALYFIYQHPWIPFYPLLFIAAKIIERFHPKIEHDQFLKKGSIKKVLVIGAGASGITAAKEGNFDDGI